MYFLILLFLSLLVSYFFKQWPALCGGFLTCVICTQKQKWAEQCHSDKDFVYAWIEMETLVCFT